MSYRVAIYKCRACGSLIEFDIDQQRIDINVPVITTSTCQKCCYEKGSPVEEVAADLIKIIRLG